MSDNIIENSLAASSGEGGMVEDAAVEFFKHPLLGCTVYSYYNYYNDDVCNGWGCRRNSQCSSDCCDGYVCSNSYCSADLAWLWWTLGSLFFILCIISMMAGARRRRRQAMLMHALHVENSRTDSQPQQTVVYVQPQQPQMGQPVTGQPVPAYNAGQDPYQQQQQQ